jgi:5-methylcytosine-specific restriction protein A
VKGGHENMKGQVFTVAKIHYINGVVYFTARRGETDLHALADNYAETTKSGNVKHPLVRVRTLARLAAGIGLITISEQKTVVITDLGKKYYDARLKNKWSLSRIQKQILCDHILSDYYRTETIYAITALLGLCKSGYAGDELAQQYAIAIGKEDAWKSEVTYKGFTQFGLNYIAELGMLEIDDQRLLLEDIAKENRYQEYVNDVQPIKIPRGNLPRPRPKKFGTSERYPSNPRRSRNALEAADFKCELDADHTTFVNKKSKKQYMEAHHLIPIREQGAFEYDIDVPENILCICPTCHRKIHLAEDRAKREILKQAYEKKQNQLPQRGIGIEFEALLEIYNISA